MARSLIYGVDVGSPDGDCTVYALIEEGKITIITERQARWFLRKSFLRRWVQRLLQRHLR